ncbi:HEAT repeat domain-containing protein [Anatilimnocola aggregata]|uniref:HEAT repeat domain-containing protein n=1 Tax=Anatilimnocola aggregata TaxID=2528021 RepID=UPI00119DD28C|nr:HEAT repeat domain-containing protein [Anatilimnocola aggregata]
MPELRSLNPWVTKDWNADEAYAPTYHRKVQDLADLRNRAPSMTPEEHQRFSAEIVAELQKEEAVVMRTELVKTLATLPTEQSRAAIQMAANDADAYVRRQACLALAKNPDATSLQILGQVLANDNDTDVRLVAAKSLGQFRDPQATQALAVAIDDNNPALQHTAMDSLKSVTGKDYGYSASAWREYVQGGTPTPPPAPSLAQQFKENWWWW